MLYQEFKQIFYSNDESRMNNPSGLRASQLISGEAFSTYMPLSQLGIQAPPGTKFYINGSDVPAIVGFTGMFDIDLTDGGSILSLKIDSQSMQFIQSNDSAVLIVDMAYWNGGES